MVKAPEWFSSRLGEARRAAIMPVIPVDPEGGTAIQSSRYYIAGRFFKVT